MCELGGAASPPPGPDGSGQSDVLQVIWRVCQVTAEKRASGNTRRQTRSEETEAKRDERGRAVHVHTPDGDKHPNSAGKGRFRSRH